MKKTVKPALVIRKSVMDLYGNSEVAQLYDQVGVQNNNRLPVDHISWIGIDKNGKYVVKITYRSEMYGDIGEHAEVDLDYAIESFPDMLYKHVLEFESFTYHKPKYWALLRWAKERSIVKKDEARVKEAKLDAEWLIALKNAKKNATSIDESDQKEKSNDETDRDSKTRKLNNITVRYMDGKLFAKSQFHDKGDPYEVAYIDSASDTF
jgi:hypothetical protein